MITEFIQALPEKFLELVEGKEGLQDMVIRQLHLIQEPLIQSRTWSTCTEEIQINGQKQQVTYSDLNIDGKIYNITGAEKFVENLTTRSVLVHTADFTEGRASFAELHACFVTAGNCIVPQYIDMAQECIITGHGIEGVLRRCNWNRRSFKVLVFVEYSDESGVAAFEELLKRLLFAEMQVLTLVDEKHFADIALKHNEVLKCFEQVISI